MKKLALAVAAVISMAVSACAIDAHFVVPNAEASFFYDNSTHRIITGISSKFLAIGDFDIRMGAAGGTWISALSYDIKKLEKLGLNVKYLWDDTSVIIGGWCGYDFEKQTGAYGEMLVVLQIGLK